MNDKPNNPVRVFISSCCDNEYEQIRKDIKKSLESYDGVFAVYSFEDAPASSLDVRSSYIFPLRDNDVVLVLLDNKYGIREGTNSEIEEAKSLGKKMLYVIYDGCDEQKSFKSARELGIKEKYKTVSGFQEMAPVAVKSVIDDVVLHYRFFNEEQFDENDALRIKYGGNITKNDLVGASCLVDLLNSLEHPNYPLDIKSESDKQIVAIAKTILGLEPLDEKLFEKTKERYVDRAAKSLRNIVSKRFDALKLYLLGDTDGALNNLIQILPMLSNVKKQYHNKWIINDIYLDIRNVSSQSIANPANRDIMNKAQKEIDGSDEKLQFPYFDRCRYFLYQSLVVNDFSENTENPSSIKLGRKGDNEAYLYISEAFLSALKYGSITLLLNFKKVYFDYKWTKYHSNYHNHYYLELIRLAAIDRDYGKIKKIIRVRKQDQPNFDSQQIESVFNSVFALPGKHQEEVATLLAASIGPLFNDEQFELLFSKVYSLSLNFVSHKENKLINNFECIFDAYANNINRVQKYIFTFVNMALENLNSYIVLYLPRLLSSVLTSSFVVRYIDKVADALIRVLKNVDNAGRYFGIAVSVCDKKKSYYGALLSLFENGNDRFLPILFKAIYDDADLTTWIEYLLNRISSILANRRNGYSLGGTSEFGELLSLLSTKQKISDSTIDHVCDVLISALESDQIISDEKIEIIKCLIVSSKHSISFHLTEFLQTLSNDYLLIINQTQDMIGCLYSKGHLFFAIEFLDAWFNADKEAQLRESLIYPLDGDKDYYKLSNFMSGALCYFDDTHFTELTNFSILQFAWKCYGSGTEETRHGGLMLIYELIKYKELTDTILRGVRDTFVFRATDEKIGLLNCVRHQGSGRYYSEIESAAINGKDYELIAFVKGNSNTTV